MIEKPYFLRQQVLLKKPQAVFLKSAIWDRCRKYSMILQRLKKNTTLS